jgi:extradiol dioxygenase family protein
MDNLPIMHLSFPIDNVDHARKFYGGVLGCAEGRKVPGRVDFNFFGHHLVAHVPKTPTTNNNSEPTIGDDDLTPLRHFGVIVLPEQFDAIAGMLKKASWPFVIEPKITAKGTAREHRFAVVRDGCGNALEFKGFNDVQDVFKG